MTEAAISILQEDLAWDLYDLAASDREEIIQLMQELNVHDIDTSAKLDNLERNRQKQKIEFGPPASSQPSLNLENVDEEEDGAHKTDTEQGQEEQPSLYDILQDDTKEDDNEDDLDPEGQD